jgi:Tfp pilus assembly protein PilN
MDYFYPVMASCLIMALFFVYQVKASNESQVVDIQEELTRINLHIDDMREAVIRKNATLGLIETEAESIKVERESLPAIFATSDISNCFNSIVDRLLQGVWLTAIDDTTNRINLQGYADRIEQVTEYMTMLGRTGKFYSVYAPTVTSSDDGDVIYFNIIAIPQNP